MSETFILIPGRTSRQGAGISQGKFGQDYQEEIHSVQMTPDDMERLGLSAGDRIRLTSHSGQVETIVIASKGDELPPGMLFVAYGEVSSRLMSGDTHGSGMPTSKGIDVQIQAI
jgi:formylmethanofuran dehydrogenase subunit D